MKIREIEALEAKWKTEEEHRKLTNSLVDIASELREALQWYVDHEDTYAEDDMDGYAVGKRRAEAALKKCESLGLGSELEGEK